MTGRGSKVPARRHAGPITKPEPHSPKWDAIISYAYLRILGETQKTAAEAAGIGERSGREYEVQTWWPDAVDEAERRWLNGMRAKARRSIQKKVEESDWQATRFTLENLDPNFQKRGSISVTDTGGNEVGMSGAEVVLYLPDNRRGDISYEEAQAAQFGVVEAEVPPETETAGQ